MTKNKTKGCIQKKRRNSVWCHGDKRHFVSHIKLNADFPTRHGIGAHSYVTQRDAKEPILRMACTLQPKPDHKMDQLVTASCIIYPGSEHYMCFSCFVPVSRT